MPTEIPQDQLQRIQPVLDKLRADLERLTEDLPHDTESALIYQPQSEAGQ
jgi:hypothetical protein